MEVLAELLPSRLVDECALWWWIHCAVSRIVQGHGHCWRLEVGDGRQLEACDSEMRCVSSAVCRTGSGEGESHRGCVVVSGVGAGAGAEAGAGSGAGAAAGAGAGKNICSRSPCIWRLARCGALRCVVWCGQRTATSDQRTANGELNDRCHRCRAGEYGTCACTFHLQLSSCNNKPRRCRWDGQQNV